MREPSLKSKRIAALADLWYEVRAACGKDIPDKDDFELSDFAPFLPNIALTKRRDDGTPFYYFFGTHLVTSFGVDMTGQDVTANMSPSAKEQFIAAVHAADELERQKISIGGRWFIGPMTSSDGRSVDIEGLTLPYRGSRGGIRRMTINEIVGGLALGDTVGGHDMKLDGVEFNARDPRPDWMHLAK